MIKVLTYLAIKWITKHSLITVLLIVYKKKTTGFKMLPVNETYLSTPNHLMKLTNRTSLGRWFLIHPSNTLKYASILFIYKVSRENVK